MSTRTLRNAVLFVSLVVPSCMLLASTDGAILMSTGSVQINGGQTGGSSSVFPGDRVQTSPNASDFMKADALGDVWTRSPGNTLEDTPVCPPLIWTDPVLIKIAPSVLASNMHDGTTNETKSTAFLSVRVLIRPPFYRKLAENQRSICGPIFTCFCNRAFCGTALLSSFQPAAASCGRPLRHYSYAISSQPVILNSLKR